MSLINWVSIVLLAFVALAALSVIVRSLRNRVPPMPSSSRVQATMMTLVRRLRLPENSIVVELGSGWGNLSLDLSRELPAGQVIGYENSPVPYGFSFISRWLFRAHNLRLLRANFYEASLREADLVVCYLSPGAMSRLQPKFTSELKPSAVVMSNTFALPEWKATRVEVVKDMFRTPIYVYSVGRCRESAAGAHFDIMEPGETHSP